MKSDSSWSLTSIVTEECGRRRMKGDGKRWKCRSFENFVGVIIRQSPSPLGTLILVASKAFVPWNRTAIEPQWENESRESFHCIKNDINLSNLFQVPHSIPSFTIPHHTPFLWSTCPAPTLATPSDAVQALRPSVTLWGQSFSKFSSFDMWYLFLSSIGCTLVTLLPTPEAFLCNQKNTKDY